MVQHLYGPSLLPAAIFPTPSSARCLRPLAISRVSWPLPGLGLQLRRQQREPPPADPAGPILLEMIRVLLYN